MLARINKPYEQDSPDDIKSFRKILREKFKIFLERRKKYGNHLENARRFPRENISGLYLKCVRIIRMIETGQEIDKDTLIDLGVYSCLILSSRENECK